MADEIDLANDLIDGELSRALTKIRQSANPPSQGSKHCLECGDDMPTERRKLGFKLCVSCVSDLERRNALFAG